MTYDFETREDLIDAVLAQISKDIEAGDFTAIQELIIGIPDRDLIAYLPEETQNA